MVMGGGQRMSEDESAVVSRDFQHGRVAYRFLWNTAHHRSLGYESGDLAALWAHLEAVRRGSIPTVPFQDPSYLRASGLRLTRMSRSAAVGFRERLFRSGMVRVYSDDPLVNALRQFHRARNSTARPLDHGVLRDFIMHDPASIALEVPVWSDEYHLSGHIDLVRFEDGLVQVCDYKPGPLETTRHRFLEALPQVAAYGEMMAYHLASTFRQALDAPLLPHVTCAVFDTHSCWRFGAELFVTLVAARRVEGL